MEQRPNPDELLAQLNAEESKRGRLKIFFGAAAGVGKTYTMLEAALARKKEGIDIVIGYVEMHKRPETAALLEGLEILPNKVIEYKNVELKEFDIDAAIKRNPKLIIVDELAHTNAPGSRHAKRWQDIEELLDKGTDVYTTLNVQHCETATDIVAQITGITVHEAVPDTVIEKADEIELVDLPTEDLLKRLKEGKVYLGEQAERAAANFFQPANLMALRQLALRYTAHNVDEKLLSYKKIHSITKVWQTRDRFLICVSPSPSAISLIRAGKRIASELGVELLVVYVETPAQLRLEDKNRLSEMLTAAEKLGAQTATLSGQDVADTLIAYARSKNVTKIIVGKPGKPRLSEFISGSLIDKLARKCGEIDLYLLSGEAATQGTKIKPAPLPPISWPSLGRTFLVVALSTLVCYLLSPYLAPINLLMFYLLGVTWVAYGYGRRMSIVASILSILFFDYFFVPPHFSFAVEDTQYFPAFIVVLVVGFTIAHLTGRLRWQTAAMAAHEDKTSALYALSSDLVKSSYPDELFKIVLRHVEDVFRCRVLILALDTENKLAVRFGEAQNTAFDQKEFAVAQWAYEHTKSAGKGTDTLPGSAGLYLPFVGAEKTVGVIGIFSQEEKQFIDPEQFRILQMFVKQAALAVEGAQLAAAALDAEAKIENERLKNLILTTFSYELPEPLAAVSRDAQELLKSGNMDDPQKREASIEKLRQDIDRLNELISELPGITRFLK